jgi:hypothetical protein
MHRIPFLLSLILILSFQACQNNPKDNKNQAASTTKIDPLLADSIIPASLKDTANLDEYGKDSLQVSIGFQRSANAMSLSYKNGDLPGYIHYLHPSVIKIYGGVDATLAKMKKRDAQSPMKFTRIITGPPKKIAAALDQDGYAHGWYCLMPVRSFRDENGKEVMDIRWLGGQTLDRGKTCHFIDITNVPNNDIYRLLPDMRFVIEENLP